MIMRIFKKDDIKTILISVLGLFLIIFIIWLRIIRRLSEQQVLLKVPLICSKLLLVLLLLLYGIIIYNTQIYLIIGDKKESFFDKFKQKVMQKKTIKLVVNTWFIMINSPKTFYTTLIYPNIRVVILLEKPLYNVARLFTKIKKELLYIIFNTLPRCFVASWLSLCVFYLHNLSSFFIILIILVFPLLYSCYLYMAHHICDQNIPYYRDHLDFIRLNANGFWEIEFAKTIPDYPDAKDVILHKNNNELLEWMVENYNIYTNIEIFIEKLDIIEAKYKPYENLYVYTSYFISWSSILLKLFDITYLL